jgi:NAD(P)-dependent dehydrogenase (short-subunit alcohol dehydrogenase family)
MVNLGLKGRRFLITGGTSGIGLAAAESLLEEGAAVGIVGRSEQRLDDALAQLRGKFPKGRIVGAAGDVASETSITAAVQQIAGELGGLDGLVGSAGIAGSYGDAPGEVDAADFLEVQQVNVVGTYLAVKATLPYLKEGTDSTITIIGSDSGFVAAPGMLAYNASKGAIVQLTRALSVELFEPFGIRVNSICPSIVDTPMSRDGMGVESFADAEFPVCSPADIAWLVLSVASPRSRAVNGASLLADFGYHARSSFPA